MLGICNFMLEIPAQSSCRRLFNELRCKASKNISGLFNCLPEKKRREYKHFIPTKLSESLCCYLGQLTYYIKTSPLHPKREIIPALKVYFEAILFFLTRVLTCTRSALKSTSETRMAINFMCSILDLTTLYQLKSRKRPRRLL